MYRRILIANRGEVADGACPAGREAGVRMVAVLPFEGGQGGWRPTLQSMPPSPGADALVAALWGDLSLLPTGDVLHGQREGS